MWQCFAQAVQKEKLEGQIWLLLGNHSYDSKLQKGRFTLKKKKKITKNENSQLQTVFLLTCHVLNLSFLLTKFPYIQFLVLESPLLLPQNSHITVLRILCMSGFFLLNARTSRQVQHLKIYISDFIMEWRKEKKKEKYI